MVKKNLELKACDFNRLSKATGNVYESVAAVSKRSTRLLMAAKLAFRAELEDLNIKEGGDNNLVDSDIQELVSKRYEMARKPLLISLDELFAGKLEITYEDDTMI